MHRKVVLFAIFILIACAACAQEAPVSYLDASVPTPDDMVHPMPADGSAVATNPPSFVWLPEPGAATYTLQISQGREFTGKTITIEGIKLNLIQPAKTMAPGKWFWRYRAVKSDGTTSAWSSVRSFTLAKDAPEFAVPPVGEIMSRISKGHPRLFVRAEDLEAFRASRLSTRKADWAALEKTIEAKKGLRLMPEPPKWKDNEERTAVWHKYFADVRVDTAAIEHLAFGYMATGNREYADEAKRYIFNFCKWDPNGVSSQSFMDELNMPIVVSITRAYDWMYDTFTPEEREQIKAMMRIRIGQFYERLRRDPYEAKPFSSHSSRALMFLGMSSIAFLGDIPECTEWLDYVTQTFSCLYPPWGGPDGSYSEGPWYWGSYMGWAFQFAYALKTATGIDVTCKPYFKNTGWYALYCIPGTNRMMPFGDGIWLAPGSGHQMNMYCLSEMYDNPYFRWYTEQFPKPLGESEMMYLWRDDSLKAKAPTDLPQSRVFYDKGIVAMHTDLVDPKQDIQFQMRSSPDGAWSHAFADQNSFYIQAFGEALAIPTGYRPMYGDEHHKNWTWQTKAHNSILVNGQGQVMRTRTSHGRIASALLSPQFDYACGDASAAYDGLTKFLRHVLFLRPGYFVMIDELATKEPSTFDWLLHAWDKMDVAPAACRLTTARGDARLLTQFVWPKEPLKISQTDQFTVPPANKAPNQWHLTCSTQKPAKEQQFVTVLYPYKAGQAQLPKIERIEGPGIEGVSLKSPGAEDVVLLNRMPSPMIAAGIQADAHIAAVRRSGGKLSSLFMADGKVLSVNRTLIASATAPVSLSLAVQRGKRSATVRCDQPADLRLKVDQNAQPKVLIGIGFGKASRRVIDNRPNPHIFNGTVKVDDRNLSPAEYAFDEDAVAVTVKLTPGEHKVEIVTFPQALMW